MLGMDCSQFCKKEAHQPFLSCDPSSWKGAYKGAWGKGRDLITSISSFGSAQAELAAPEWGDGGCKRHWELLCCAWEGSSCVKMPACHTGSAGHGLFLCLLEQQPVHARNNGTACQQGSLGIICG